ncbi:GAF domain-containing protein [Pseudonocardia sp. KRD-184]|uniref:GAF domain-containing protein n=1 Tax=Pseudonocardia oceani TaxID=2792013 RepID=A0ABS6U696_9PSEU|nr:GAF domain-containing protein [Pseudonocardia oceani]MBW0091343.1 GAF domain-containing protein [Pseudonocardia oceani]MBW0098422.1 GAF domain-containing protein [Pseudonocardia oceani]MBW0124997.1 GAF domain-containing protein [Pseudonocardia oceani]MBW0127496.1 GAF domain-containing protein [Pseudonocardia oceani]
MPAFVEIEHAIARRPVTGLDPLLFLGDAAERIAGALDARGVVLVVPSSGWVRGSDDVATLVGEVQHRDGHGPVSTAARTGRPVLTHDLTRIGPPALAAIAGEEGLAAAATTALAVDGRVVAVLQVLGHPGRPPAQSALDALGGVLEVVAARIVDLLELGRRRQADEPAAAAPVEDRTRALPVTPAVSVDIPRPATPVGSERLRVVRPEPEHGEEPASEPRFVRELLGAAEPELVTEELRAVGGVPLPRHRAR